MSYLPFSLASLGGDNHGTPESARSMSRKRPAAGSPATDDTTTPSRRLVDRVVVDVGGTRFSTSTSTLTASSSYFQRLFSDRWASSDDECFLDGDPEPFAILLSYMRRGHLDLPESLAQRVLLEAEFLGVDSLLVEVKARAHRNCTQDARTAMPTRRRALTRSMGACATRYVRECCRLGTTLRCPNRRRHPSPRWFSSSQRREGCV